MKRSYFWMGISLVISLFIYVFYRTEKTVINTMITHVISLNDFVMVRETVTGFLPLPETAIYSLPEGLWVFSITLASKPFYISMFPGGRINCVVLPVVYAVGLELFQLMNITNGRFDFMDIWISLLFWFLGISFLNEPDKQSILRPFTLKGLVCLLSYGIVYLSHVLQ